MKTTLYEFMPYGAPDLIEARSRHLSRALVLACATAIVLLGVAFGIGSLIPEKTLITVDTIPITPHDQQQIAVKQPLPPPAPLVQPKVMAPAKPSPVAVPVPVPDAKAPVVNDQPPSTPMPSATQSTGPATSVTAEPAGDQLPAPGTYVYVEHLPEPLKQVKPAYSEIAKSAGVQGLVRVNVLVGKDGHVLDARLDDKAQIPLLNDEALKAARQWVFSAGTTNGQPVACWVMIPFNFRLH